MISSQFLARIAFVLASVVGLLFLTGCRAEECRQMIACCEAVQDVDGVGASCTGLAEETRDPTTCRSVVQTIGYMFEEKDEPLPEACQ